jgi:hypothetical protein
MNKRIVMNKKAEEVKKLWIFQPYDDVYICSHCDWSITVEKWSTTNYKRLKPIWDNAPEHMAHVGQEMSDHMDIEHPLEPSLESRFVPKQINKMTIELIRNKDSYEFSFINDKHERYIWSAAYDNPFEMLQPINSALFEEMWDHGWRKIEEGQK